MAYKLGVALPLQLGIRSPRVDAQIVLFVRQGRIVFRQFFVNLGSTTEFLGTVALYER